MENIPDFIKDLEEYIDTNGGIDFNSINITDMDIAKKWAYNRLHYMNMNRPNGYRNEIDWDTKMHKLKIVLKKLESVKENYMKDRVKYTKLLQENLNNFLRIETNSALVGNETPIKELTDDDYYMSDSSEENEYNKGIDDCLKTMEAFLNEIRGQRVNIGTFNITNDRLKILNKLKKEIVKLKS